VSRTSELTTSVKAQIDDKITQPYYLIELGFATPLYYSTLYAKTLDAKSYIASRKVVVSTLVSDKNGNVRGNIVIDNTDRAISVTILGESPAGLSAVIYKIYGENAVSADKVMLFSGHMDKSSVEGNVVKIDLYSDGSEQLSPSLVIAKPYFNWLPPAGTSIVIGTTTITLDKAS